VINGMAKRGNYLAVFILKERVVLVVNSVSHNFLILSFLKVEIDNCFTSRNALTITLNTISEHSSSMEGVSYLAFHLVQCESENISQEFTFLPMDTKVVKTGLLSTFLNTLASCYMYYLIHNCPKQGVSSCQAIREGNSSLISISSRKQEEGIHFHQRLVGREKRKRNRCHPVFITQAVENELRRLYTCHDYINSQSQSQSITSAPQ